MDRRATDVGASAPFAEDQIKGDIHHGANGSPSRMGSAANLPQTHPAIPPGRRVLGKTAVP